MDERIDLTQNRDFRHEREPYFKDAHFFNFNPKYRNSKWISLERRMRNNCLVGTGTMKMLWN